MTGIFAKRVGWTTLVGAVLTVVGATLTTVLSLGAFANAANATSEISRNVLAQPAQVDKAAQEKYLDKLTAEKAAAEAAQQAQNQQNIAKNNLTNSASNSANNNANNVAKNPTTSADNSRNAAPAQPVTYSYDRLIIPKIGLSTRLATGCSRKKRRIGVQTQLCTAWCGVEGVQIVFLVTH